MELFFGIALVVLIILIYVATYILNEKTKVPEGCENLTDFSGCQTCSNSACQIKPKVEKKNNVK